MNLETFFEKFDQFTDAPDAVAKIRELVLQFAVKGEFSGNSSKEWKSFSLGDLLEVQNGFAFKSSFFNEVRQGMPLIRIRDIANEDTQVYYSGEYREEFVVRKGDLIIGMDGNFNIHRWKGMEALLNQRVCRLVGISTEIDQQFLFYFLQRHLDEIHRVTTYTTVKHISSKQIRSIELPLPPIAEQKSIVAKVDELMDLCDRLEAHQQERDTKHADLARASLARFAEAPTPENLQFIFHKSYDIPPADLRKSILTLAVQGKLVPSMGRTEVLPLGEILAEPSSNGISKGPTSDTTATEVLRISAGTSRDDFYVNEEDFKHVSLSAQEIEKAKLRSGDLLACRYNGNLHYVGMFSLYRGISGRTQVNPDKLIRFRVDTSRHDPRYVCFSMNAEPTREPIEAMCATTAGNIGLSAGRIKTVTIPLPPLAEQRRIVAKVDQLMALVDELETQFAASRTTAANLLSALVGELTGTVPSGKVSASTSTGRRGRPKKS